MLLVIGLGNPGKAYANTRHNLGYMMVDRIAQAYNITLHQNKKLLSKIAIIEILNYKLVIAQSTMYMNLSGKSVQLMKNYYKISTEDIIVIHDDLDLQVGKVKAKYAGSSAGHNGLNSIDHLVGNQYTRIRIGIGRPEYRVLVSSYVLSNILSSEMDIVSNIFNNILNNFHYILAKDLQTFNDNFR